jgi:hypothetical protein
MSDSETALEHLRVIRFLMEKATVYRAVTVPTAVVGGLIAVILSIILYFSNTDVAVPATISIWLAAFVLINAINHGLIWRASQNAKEPYFSSGLSMALKAVIPALFVGGLLGLALGYGPQGDLIGATWCWVTFYGLALMATSGFSPRSLRLLGMAFTLIGAAGLAAHWSMELTEINSEQRVSALVMGLTFGVLHLLYAFSVRISTNRDG